MTIGGIGGNTNASAGSIGMGNPNMDSYSKSLQKQITDAQKQLQELSQNSDMDTETKMKKRQEIQKQISDLNMQLRQHQMEERKKAQQEKQAKSQPKKAEEKESGLSTESMEAMISAEGSMKQAAVHGSTATQMENGARIKRSEIARDGGSSQRTSDDSAAISSKWDAVEDMEQKAKMATASQASLLAEAQSKMSEVNAESGNSTSAKTEEKSEEKAKAEGEAAVVDGAETADEVEAVSTTVTVVEPEAETPVSTSSSKNQSAEIGSNIDVKV